MLAYCKQALGNLRGMECVLQHHCTDQCFDPICNKILLLTFVWRSFYQPAYHFRWSCVRLQFLPNTSQQTSGRISSDKTATRLRSIRPNMPLSTIQVFDLCAGSFAAISSFVLTAAELSLLLLGLSLGHHWSHQSLSRPVWATTTAFTLISSLWTSCPTIGTRD